MIWKTKIQRVLDSCYMAICRIRVYGGGECSDELFDFLLTQPQAYAIELSENVKHTILVVISGSLEADERNRLFKELGLMTENVNLLILGQHQKFQKMPMDIDMTRFKNVTELKMFIPSVEDISNAVEELCKQKI